MMNDAAYVYERHPYISIFQLREQAGLISPLSAETTRQGTLCQLGFVCMGMRWRVCYEPSIHVNGMRDERPDLDLPSWTDNRMHVVDLESGLFFLALLLIFFFANVVYLIIFFHVCLYDLL